VRGGGERAMKNKTEKMNKNETQYKEKEKN
jgi:hypothetical protein